MGNGRRVIDVRVEHARRGMAQVHTSCHRMSKKASPSSSSNLPELPMPPEVMLLSDFMKGNWCSFVNPFPNMSLGLEKIERFD